MYISIVITAYNAEIYIIKTLESIMAQTYKHYEVIIIDDGSTDDTIKCVGNFIQNYELANFKIISLNHIGRVNALNHGISVAQYDSIAIIDADDLWHPQKLDIQVHFIKKFGLVMLSTDCLNFEKELNNDLMNTIANDNMNDAILVELSLNQMLRYNSISHSSIIMNKRLACYHPGDIHDWDLFLRTLSEGTKIHQLKLNLTYHRIHNNQSFEAKKHIRYTCISCALQLKYCIRLGKLMHMPFVFARFIYHLILNRKIRIKLHTYLTNC